MTEQQAQAATAVYGQLVAARQELGRLAAIRPLLQGVTLCAAGAQPVAVQGVNAARLAATADVVENELRGRIADLEAKLSEL